MKIRYLVLSIFVFFTSALHAEQAYLQERLDFASKPGYNAYELQLITKKLLDRHFELAGTPGATMAEINEPLKNLDVLNPLGIQVQSTIAEFLDYVVSLSGESEKAKALANVAEEKRLKADAILNSIVENGTGESPESAFQIINLMEEHAVIDHFGFEEKSQSVVEQNGKVFDVLTVVDAQGQEQQLWFDISLFIKTGKSAPLCI